MNLQVVRRILRGVASASTMAALVGLVCGWRPAGAQQAMTVTGHVMAGGNPVQDATVGIREWDISATTNSDGWYSFIIPASRVRGQAQTVTVRHVRYGTRTATIVLVGGSLVQDFSFDQPEAQRPQPQAAVQPGTPRGPARQALQGQSVRTVDSTAFDEAAGPLDMVSALAGRMPGLLVTSATGPGSSAFMVYRGPRSVSGPVQPLVVLDGVPLDNSSFATASQQFGLGGFDYGSPLQDVPLDDIASATLLTGAEATALYGARAANGVLVVTSKRGRGLTGFEVSASVRRTGETASRLPSFQNAFGQGLGGKFEFLNGTGGGINDAVDQSWGPALNGQPIPQASYTQPRQAEVRQWLAHPSGVQDYFGGAHTLDADAALQGSSDWGDLRVALNARNATGLTPSNTLRRLGGTLVAGLRPSSQLSIDANLRVIGSESKDRPGTGFDVINPVAEFTRLPRQVDLGALSTHLKDSTQQINWIYTLHNNPYFQTSLNSNTDRRAHVTGGATATYAASQRVNLFARAATDDDHENRNFDVASADWLGGYPTAIGRASFAGGGSQRQTLTFQQSLVTGGVSVSGPDSSSVQASGSAGLEYRFDSFDSKTAVADRASGGGSGTLNNGDLSGSDNVAAAYVSSAFVFGDAFHLSASVRGEKPGSGLSRVFPSVLASYDVVHSRGSGTAPVTVHGAWWRAGNELTSSTLAQVYTGATTSCAPICASASPTLPVLGVQAVHDLAAETTDGLELGATASTAGGRLTLDVTGYRERSSDVLLALAASNNSVATAQTGQITNQGVEAALRGIILQQNNLQWSGALLYSRNSNSVDALNGGANEIALGPSLWGAGLVARPGEPVGTIVGTRFLRDATSHQLLLKNGRPIADTTRSVLGSWEPDWMGSVQNTVRVGGAELSFLVDARIGGSIFSATNLWGSYAGTLASTANRPATGLVIAGVDSATRQPNSTGVSAEDYFHALGGIHEAWVYDASFVKLRDVRLAYTLPLSRVSWFREQTLKLSLIGRNLAMWAKAPNIDPETTLSTGGFQGFEMGQLPTTRSIGLQVTIQP